MKNYGLYLVALTPYLHYINRIYLHTNSILSSLTIEKDLYALHLQALG